MMDVHYYLGGLDFSKCYGRVLITGSIYRTIPGRWTLPDGSGQYTVFSRAMPVFENPRPEHHSIDTMGVQWPGGAMSWTPSSYPSDGPDPDITDIRTCGWISMHTNTSGISYEHPIAFVNYTSERFPIGTATAFISDMGMSDLEIWNQWVPPLSPTMSLCTVQDAWLHDILSLSEVRTKLKSVVMDRYPIG